MFTASFCIEYSKFYCLPNLTTFEASNRYKRVAVDNSHFFIHIGKTMPCSDVKNSQKISKVISKFMDSHSILSVDRSQFHY